MTLFIQRKNAQRWQFQFQTISDHVDNAEIYLISQKGDKFQNSDGKR